MLKVLGVIFFFALINGEIFERQCRTIEEYGGVVENFNYVAYSGNWYEIERYDAAENTFDHDCSRASYTNEIGSVYTYVVEYSQRNLANGIRSSATGRSRVSFPDEIPLRGMLNTTMIPQGATDRSNYWILSTDYSNYAFVVNCVNLNQTHSRENYWLFGRTHPLPQAARDRADALIDQHLERDRIRSTIQDFESCIL